MKEKREEMKYKSKSRKIVSPQSKEIEWKGKSQRELIGSKVEKKNATKMNI